MDGIEQGLSEIRYETRLRHKNGHYVPMEIRARSLNDTQGNIVGGVLAARDITKRLQVDEERNRTNEALRESEDRFRTIIDKSPLGMSLIDIDGRYEYVNPAFVKIFGYDLSDIPTGKEWFRTVFPDPEYRREAMADWKEDLSSYPKLEIRPRTYEVRCKEGAFKTIHFRPVSLPSGKQLITYEDITERKEAEDTLVKSERKYRMVLETNPDPMIVYDKEGKVIYLNPAFTSVFGWSLEERIGKKLDDFVPDESWPETRMMINMVIAGENFSGIETIRLTREGKVIPVSISGSCYRNNEGNIEISVINLRDITERKLAEEELLKSEEKFRTIFDRASDGILIADPVTKKFLQGNTAICSMTGYTKEEIECLTVYDIHPPEDVSHVLDEFEKLLKKEKALAENLPVLRKDGSIIYADIGSAHITIGGIHYLVGIFRDITERKRTEEELLKADKLESVGILAGGIAHDFNNILTSISGNISMAKMLVKPGHKISYLLSAAETSSIRAQGLTRQLLTFAKGGTPIKEIASIQKLIRESSFFVLQGSKSRCELQIAEDLWPVETDTGQISQVISNMVINANQAMPEGGTIHITAENMMPENITEIPVEPGRYIRISIKDQGVGIAEKHLPKIFDPYFTTKQAGSGLGLATSYSIIKKHNGYISVDSIPGAGTTFAIYLPASDKEIPEREESDLLTGEGKLLVMDDDRILREMMREMLEMLGYDAQFAKDGAEAIEMYRKAKESGKPYDAVILDLTIPGGMGGQEVIKILLEMDPEVKAVVFSGYSDGEVMLNYREYGFKGMMPKPFDAYALGKVLNDVLKQDHFQKSW